MDVKIKFMLDCDFFENKRVAPRRFKIKRIRSNQFDSINTKLDCIISNMGLIPPSIDIDGTYDVKFGNITAGRFYNRRLAEEYVKRFQQEFSKPLVIKKVKIKSIFV